ncbi:ABC-type glycerol-3-phosphate transport system permease component [Paenibacillus phyllosphaerae]|uniref:ABC-type glycerol-3-phosphate transport system permease component n=1 Tax=Paenibacillus phyllosphaerae TaxID=274593 RepID=A0A7W5B624_9BACL|nr:carbohydrate ABC transporter permease [Paenibacillus phyllosphaerae]MBB3114631.1 ABC-type glycerol-3-phosphate transport system permease component [Paenibacillus phyllosphaerae]
MNTILSMRKKRVNRSFMGSFSLFVMLAIVGAFMALPLVYAINSAFKPLDEIFLFPPTLFVRNPTFTNFVDLMTLLGQSWVPFSRYIFNTFFITGMGVVGHVILASAAAYPLAKHVFPGKAMMFQTVVLSLMFTGAVTSIPNYMIMSWLGFIDTYWAVIVPAFAYPLGLYLMKQFMEQLPDSLLEAAKIDGASEYRIFWQVVMPNVKPAWLTLVILLFQLLWGTDGNGFIYSEQLKTLHYASGQIIQGGIARAGVGAAVALILMSVPITLFVLSQSRIIETMATSGMKD